MPSQSYDTHSFLWCACILMMHSQSFLLITIYLLTQCQTCVYITSKPLMFLFYGVMWVVCHFQIYLLMALQYSCTLVTPCAAATSPTHCCEMWLHGQRHLPIVTSQWVFTVTLLDHCLSSHFMNGAVTSALAKQQFIHCKFEQNCRLVIFNSDIIYFLNTFCVNWYFHLYKSIHQTLSLR